MSVKTAVDLTKGLADDDPVKMELLKALRHHPEGERHGQHETDPALQPRH